MNSNLGGGNHAAGMVEEQVVNWMKEILGLPDDASGSLVSGGSMANFVGTYRCQECKSRLQCPGAGHAGSAPTIDRVCVYRSA